MQTNGEISTMDNSRISRAFSYAILSFVKDTMRGTSVPVGVALWSPSPEFFRIHVINEGERTKGLPLRAMPFIQLTKEKLLNWMKREALPYSTSSLKPSTSEWWRHASRLLTHNLRISEPRSIECRNPEEEIELLYEAVVAPIRIKRERAERVNGVLTRALGELANKLPGGPVPGYKGRDVWVHRHAENDNALLIVEAVNLAATTAESDTDSLVSRLLRVREGNGIGVAQKQIAVMVGYPASPEGLNGEAALRDWIEKKVDAKTFDLINQEGQFRDAVNQGLSAVA